MGKIRIKTFEESPEEEAKLKAKKEAKKAEKMALKNAAKKDEETPVTEAVEVVVTPEEIIETPNETVVTPEETVSTEVIARSVSDEAISETETKNPPSLKLRKGKEKFVKVKEVGKRHKENLSIVSKNQTYSIEQALEALKKFKKSKFDETVELHINTKEKGVSGQVTLPHGTGKTLVIKIADDTIIAEVAKGKINFDILVATPSMMPQLARVAKVLGPRGLMPNPKNGTITDKPEEAVKKLSAGQISYKTEAISPIIHVSVGKISFEDKKLKENIATLLSSVGAAKISSVTLKSTMSPAIRLEYSAFVK
jgi:large subunit ribosomal protein L1